MCNSTCLPITRHKKWEERKRNLDLCGGFWKRANMQRSKGLFLDENKKAGAMPKVSPCPLLKTVLQQLGLWLCSVSTCMLLGIKHWKSLHWFQDIDAAGPYNCADPPLSICNINHIQYSGIQPGKLSDNRLPAQTNCSPGGGEEEAGNDGLNGWRKESERWRGRKERGASRQSDLHLTV